MRQRLQFWVAQGFVLRQESFYALGAPQKMILERKNGEERAESMWTKACQKAALINQFPFVRAVFISGSISKGVVAEDGDVDFFIITKPERLWLSRTLLALYKKVFLLGSHRYFCINYFIDNEFLTIEEQNNFTATEIATLIPMVGERVLISDFFAANSWVKRYYPNFTEKQIVIEESAAYPFRNFIEACLDFCGGNFLDKLGQRVTTTFWKKKFKGMPRQDFNSALKSNRHVSKHHPLQFQKRVLNALKDKVVAFEDDNGLKLEV